MEAPPTRASILVVDDDPGLCETLKDVLEDQGYEVDTARTGQEAIEKLGQRYYNLALLDVKLPDMAGTELLATLKALRPETMIIIVTGHASLDSVLEALHSEAFAYIVKPLVIKEFLGKIEKALEKQRSDLESRQRLAEERREKELYKSLAARDGLTGLYNRRHFNEALDREIARAKRYGQPLSALLLDIDNFKKLNDTYGHPAGDRALKLVAQSLKESTRSADIVARYGGEEFVILMPQTGKEDALRAAERLKSAVEQAQKEPREVPEPLTISVGVASYPEDASDEEGLLSRADQELYKNKRRRGRDTKETV